MPDSRPAQGKVVRSVFSPAWWLVGPHRQTVWPYLLRFAPRPPYRRERLELDDGDFLDLDWVPGPLPGYRGLALLLHGLEGSSRSHYMRGLSQALANAGYLAVVLHFRGCSGEPNRLPRAYHSGETGDLGQVVRILAARYSELPRAAVGFSLGGNVLLKWLGENPQQESIDAAIAVSVPFDLSKGADRLNSGLSRVYQRRLLTLLKNAQYRKLAVMELPLDVDAMKRAGCFREFDQAVTAPLHGFPNASEYYRRSSSRPWLSKIKTETLILQAVDDPFLPPDAIPECRELGIGVELELSVGGGHVGFIAGNQPFKPQFWLEERILSRLDERLVEKAAWTRWGIPASIRTKPARYEHGNLQPENPE